MFSKPRCLILVIRVTISLTLVLIWIIPRPRQNIGGAFLCACTTSTYR